MTHAITHEQKKHDAYFFDSFGFFEPSKKENKTKITAHSHKKNFFKLEGIGGAKDQISVSQMCKFYTQCQSGISKALTVTGEGLWGTGGVQSYRSIP